MQHCSFLSWKSQRFPGSAMGIAIANRKNRCDFGALRFQAPSGTPHLRTPSEDPSRNTSANPFKNPSGNPSPVRPLKGGASFFGIEMSFLWYRGGPSLLFGIEISFFCCSASISSSSWDQPVRALLGLDILQSGGQRRSRYRKEARKISIPKERHFDTN